MFVEPLSDVKKQGWIWRLKKPLYGLNDASRKCWLHVIEVLLCELGHHKVNAVKAFYFSNENGILHGEILTHFDDFKIAGRWYDES